MGIYGSAVDLGTRTNVPDISKTKIHLNSYTTFMAFIRIWIGDGKEFKKHLTFSRPRLVPIALPPRVFPYPLLL